MKLSCPTTQLADALRIVGHAVAVKNSISVLSNVLLTADQDRLQLAATNLEIAITCSLEANVMASGATTVPARLLSDFVNSLSAGSVELSLNQKNETIALKSGAFDANIKGITAEDFPEVAIITGDSVVSVPADVLRDAINQVAFAAAQDDTRPVLAGVLLRLDGDDIVMATADGFRLAVRHVMLGTPVPEAIEVIVPARALQELAKIIGNDKGPVDITVTPARVLFHTTAADLTARTIEGKFPNYAPIIPKTHTTRIAVNTRDFEKAVKVAALFARDASYIVRLKAAADKLVVAAHALETGDSAGSVDASVEGDPLEVALNVKYLLEALGAINSSHVALEANGAMAPVLFLPVGHEGYQHVIMPMSAR